MCASFLIAGLLIEYWQWVQYWKYAAFYAHGFLTRTSTNSTVKIKQVCVIRYNSNKVASECLCPIHCKASKSGSTNLAHTALLL